MTASKNLYLMRHGNAPMGSTDWERELDLKGEQEVSNVAKSLVGAKQWPPEKLLCSPAIRARRSCEKLMEQAGDSLLAEVEFVKGLYNADSQYVCDLLGNLEDSISSCLVLGHNPSLSVLASQLMDENVYLGTSDLLHLQANIDSISWSACLGQSWKLLDHLSATTGQE